MPPYRESTYSEVLCWEAETEIEFVPHGKKPGTKSYDRYEAYAKAKTVAQVLEFGAKPQDLLHDFEKGLLKYVGGPKRNEPLDIMQEGIDCTKLTSTDLVLGRWCWNLKAHSIDDNAAFEERQKEARRALSKVKLGQKYGVKDARDLRGGNWAEAPAMVAARTSAQNEAVRILEEVEASGRKVTSEDVLAVLRLWKFRNNGTRVDVMPEGVKTIFCDRMGLMQKETGYMVTKETEFYPKVVGLFSRWLRDNRPEGFDTDWPFTSIYVNSAYGCRIHRDKYNLGPTINATFGDFTGGRLEYWPEDDKTLLVDDLPEAEKQQLDCQSKPVVMDGNRAHAVEAFEGERFSLVFHLSDKYQDTPETVRAQLAEAGIAFPTLEAVQKAQKLLGPQPQGYAGVERGSGKSRRREELRGRQSPISESTYKAAYSWVDETRIKYLQGAKDGQDTKCAKRYQIYSKARSIGEALKLGALPQDLLNDYQKQFLQVIKGTVHRDPAKFDGRRGNALERYLFRMRNALGSSIKLRTMKLSRALKLSQKLGIDLKAKAEGSNDPQEVCAMRSVADQMAARILESKTASGRRVTNQEVRSVLNQWSFKKNESRKNVMNNGQTYVHSDTLGLVGCRNGTYIATRQTLEYPNVPRVLLAWLKDRLPPCVQGDFPCTSINLNYGYAARRHRDDNNAGPSFIAGFGSYTGGQLGYWPEDNHGCHFDKLRMEDRVTLDTSKNLVLFDGCRAHEVDDFEGERFSVVFFSCGNFWHTSEESRKQLMDLGFHVPLTSELGPISQVMPLPRGYGDPGQRKLGDAMSDGSSGEPRVFQWPMEERAEEEAEATKLLATLMQPSELMRPLTGVPPAGGSKSATARSSPAPAAMKLKFAKAVSAGRRAAAKAKEQSGAAATGEGGSSSSHRPADDPQGSSADAGGSSSGPAADTEAGKAKSQKSEKRRLHDQKRLFALQQRKAQQHEASAAASPDPKRQLQFQSGSSPEEASALKRSRPDDGSATPAKRSRVDHKAALGLLGQGLHKLKELTAKHPDCGLAVAESCRPALLQHMQQVVSFMSALDAAMVS